MDPSHTARITCFSNTPISPDLRSSWVQQHMSSGFKSSFFPLAELHKTSTRNLSGKTSAHTILHLITPKLPAEILLCFLEGCNF